MIGELGKILNLEKKICNLNICYDLESKKKQWRFDHIDK
jgi:hypothetical protein